MGNTESKFTSFYKFLDKKGVELQNGELVVLRKCASLDSRRKEYSVLLYNQSLLEKWVKERLPSSEVNEALSACIKNTKTIISPFVLKFYGYKDYYGQPCLIIEPVNNLDGIIARLTCQEVIVGLSQLLQALEFLHERAGLCHNNVKLGCVFVSQDGTWKLGRFELCKRLASDDETQSMDSVTKDFTDYFDLCKRALDGKDLDNFCQAAMKEILKGYDRGTLKGLKDLMQQTPLVQINKYLRSVMTYDADEKIASSKLCAELISSINPTLLFRTAMPLLLAVKMLMLDCNAALFIRFFEKIHEMMQQKDAETLLFVKNSLVPFAYSCLASRDKYLRIAFTNIGSTLLPIILESVSSWEDLKANVMIHLEAGIEDQDNTVHFKSLVLLCQALCHIVEKEKDVNSAKLSFYPYVLKWIYHDSVRKETPHQYLEALFQSVACLWKSVGIAQKHQMMVNLQSFIICLLHDLNSENRMLLLDVITSINLETVNLMSSFIKLLADILIIADIDLRVQCAKSIRNALDAMKGFTMSDDGNKSEKAEETPEIKYYRSLSLERKENFKELIRLPRAHDITISPKTVSTETTKAEATIESPTDTKAVDSSHNNPQSSGWDFEDDGEW